MKMTNSISQDATREGFSNGTTICLIVWLHVAPEVRALCSSSGLIAMNIAVTFRVANGRNRAI